MLLTIPYTHCITKCAHTILANLHPYRTIFTKLLYIFFEACCLLVLFVHGIKREFYILKVQYAVDDGITRFSLAFHNSSQSRLMLAYQIANNSYLQKLSTFSMPLLTILFKVGLFSNVSYYFSQTWIDSIHYFFHNLSPLPNNLILRDFKLPT